MIADNFSKNCSIDYILGHSLRRLKSDFEEVFASTNKHLEIEDVAEKMNEKLKE